MVNIISDYIPPFSPLPNIAPFTYKDGETYLSTLENLRSYVNVTLVDFINTNFSSLGNDFILEIATLTSTVNTALNNQIATVTGQLAAQNTAVTGQLATQTTANNTAISNLTTYVNAQVAIIVANGIVANDPVVTGIVNNTASTSRIALDNLYKQYGYFEAEKYKTATNTDLQALQAACAAATAAGNANMVRISARTWNVGNGFSMSGYSCGLIGFSAGYNGTTATGSTLFASTQTGAVLDMTGWVGPDSYRGKVEFGNFNLLGSNVADPTKVNIGLRNATNALGSVYMHDIGISKTGGPGVDMYQAYLSDFARIVVTTPVNAKVNDIAYMIFRGCNGNRFIGLGFRSMTPNTDTGVSGALVNINDAGYGAEYNEWIAPWFEFLHVPTNGCFINNKATAQKFSGVYFVDCSKEASATGTSYVHFDNSPFNNSGANIWLGVVPGFDSTTPTVSPDAGIIINQSRNMIQGPKGFKGNNVVLNAGVTNTTAIFAGSQSGATDIAVTDNSGNLTNVYFDHTNRIHKWGSWIQDEMLSNNGGAGLRITDAATPTNGALHLGNLGARISSVNGFLYNTGDAVYFKDSTLAAMGQIDRYTGWQLNGAIEFINPDVSTVAPAAGAAAALPTTPAGYVTITIAGTARKLPYY